MTIILGAILVVSTLILIILVLFLLNLRAVLAGISAFATPAREGETTPLAELVAQISGQFSDDIMSKAKHTFLGMQGGAARQSGAVEGAIAEDLVSIQSPVLGAIMQAFPALSKKIQRNPGLAPLALQYLAPMLKGGGGSSGPGNGEKQLAEPNFNL